MKSKLFVPFACAVFLVACSSPSKPIKPTEPVTPTAPRDCDQPSRDDQGRPIPLC